MKNTDINGSKVSLELQGKDTIFLSQKKIVFLYLQTHTATASMVCEATEILQKNFCRIKRNLEKADLLWETVKAPCQNTGQMAWYLTTNKELTNSDKSNNNQSVTI